MSMFQCARYTERDTRNMRTFNIWMIAAMLLFAATTILLGRRFLLHGPLAWLLIVATITLLAGAVATYMRFLRESDELLRKINLESLALAFGIGLVFMIGWRLFERVGAPHLDVDDPIVVMFFAWALGQWLGSRRYLGEAA